MRRKLSPIILIVYNRPWHTRMVLSSLSKNRLSEKSELFVFSDGPKDKSDEIEVGRISDVRKVVKEKKWCGKVHLLEKMENEGLVTSMMKAVTQLVEKYGEVIVLEDDLVLSPWFLTYMNKALETYKTDEKVISVTGYCLPIDKTGLSDSFLVPKWADCWGFGTWKRAWRLFNQDASDLLSKIKSNNQTYEFDFGGKYQYSKMLESAANNPNTSWAVKWYATAFVNNMFSLCPRETLVKNVGNDGSGTHPTDTTSWDSDLGKDDVEIKRQNHDISDPIRGRFVDYFSKRPNKESVLKEFKEQVIRWVPPIISKLYFEKTIPKYGFSGNYKTWESAKSDSTGYGTKDIFNTVIDSARLVKKGAFAYERDGVVFEKIEYSWPLMATLSKVFNDEGRLNVLDFGGALGSSYNQVKGFDSRLPIKWNIVEQKEFVEAGKREFENEELSFYLTIEECLKHEKPNFVLLSGVLQYINDPFEWIEDVKNAKFPHLFIDRSLTVKSGRDRIVVQRVPEKIYNASYPAWIFDEKRLINKFMPEYVLQYDFPVHESVTFDLGDTSGFYKGYYFKINQ